MPLGICELLMPMRKICSEVRDGVGTSLASDLTRRTLSTAPAEAQHADKWRNFVRQTRACPLSGRRLPLSGMDDSGFFDRSHKSESRIVRECGRRQHASGGARATCDVIASVHRTSPLGGMPVASARPRAGGSRP